MADTLNELILSDRSLDLITRRLRSGSHDDRVQALSILGQARPHPLVSDILLEVAKDPDPAIRALALKTLTRHNVNGSVPLAVLMLDDPDASVRRQAVDILGEFRMAQTVALIVEKLHDPDPWVRWSAINAVRWNPTEDVIEAIRLNLFDEFPMVRRRACEVYALDFRPIPINDMLYLLNDEDRWVRFWAIEGLRAAADERALDGLLACLYDEDRMIQERAVQTLGYLGFREAIPHLNRMLQDAVEMQTTVTSALRRIYEIHADELVKPGANFEQPTQDEHDPDKVEGGRRSLILKLISKMQGAA